MPWVVPCKVWWLMGRCVSVEGCVHVWRNSKTTSVIADKWEGKVSVTPLCWTFF